MSVANSTAPQLKVKARSLVLLIGSSGSGKSTFAKKNFQPSQVISSDSCRGLVCDDESDQHATAAAFALVHLITAKRMEFGRLCVVDATNIEASARESLLSLARENSYPSMGIIFDIGLEAAVENNRSRTRRVPEEVIVRHVRELQASRSRLAREGYARVHVFRSTHEASSARVTLE